MGSTKQKAPASRQRFAEADLAIFYLEKTHRVARHRGEGMMENKCCPECGAPLTYYHDTERTRAEPCVVYDAYIAAGELLIELEDLAQTQPDTGEEYCDCRPTVSSKTKCGKCGKQLR